MMLIGITGGSGTGKSTITNFIKEKIGNCVTIKLDDYMRKYWNEHKEEIISKLDLNIENDHWHIHLVNNQDDVEKWASIIGPDIERDVRNIILENNTAKVIILDWAFLPLLPLYNECVFSILVKCDLNTRLNRIIKRLDKNGKLSRWNDDTLLNRLKNSSLDEWGYSATYTISNDGTLEDLEYNVDCILDTYFNNDLIFK